MDSFKTGSDIFLTLLPLKIESSSPPLLMDYPYWLYFSKLNEVEIMGRVYETWLIKELEFQSIPLSVFTLGLMSQGIWVLLPWRHQAAATVRGKWSHNHQTYQQIFRWLQSLTLHSHSRCQMEQEWLIPTQFCPICRLASVLSIIVVMGLLNHHVLVVLHGN